MLTLWCFLTGSDGERERRVASVTGSGRDAMPVFLQPTTLERRKKMHQHPEKILSSLPPFLLYKHQLDAPCFPGLGFEAFRLMLEGGREVDLQPTRPVGRCYDNVAEHVEKHGGRSVLGWSLLADGLTGKHQHCLAGFSLTYHSVWESDSGELIDITNGRFKTCMFIPHNVCRAAQSIDFLDEPSVDPHFLTSYLRPSQVWLIASGTGEYFDLGVTRRGHAPKLGRNSPCPCGSGKKVKKCCNLR